MTNAPQSIEELHDRASEPSAGVLAALQHINGDVIVAGAGGKMGFHLCLMLRRGFDSLGKSNKVIAVSRFGDPATKPAFEDRSIQSISADLTSRDTVESLPDAAAVFYLAGQKFGTSDSPEILRLFNEEMPLLVAERYARTPIVALSTGCVYPFVSPQQGGCQETEAVAPKGAYATSCLGRENAFVDASGRDGTPISLIRLNYSVDLRYGVLVDLATYVISSEPVDVTMGYLNCIWQGDAIEYTIRALEFAAPAPAPFILNVTGPQILSVRETATRLAEQFGTTVTFTGSEAKTAWLNNAEKSHRLMGAPRISENTLIDWVADWVKNDRPLLGKPTHFEVRDGKY